MTHYFDHIQAPSGVNLVQNGFRINVQIRLDEDPDLSYLGEFSDTPEKNAIDHHETGTWLSRSDRGPRYFNAADPNLTEEEIRKNYDRLVEYYQGYWSTVGIVVTASRASVTLGVQSLWGLESDMDLDFFDEEIDQLISGALNDALRNLERVQQPEGEEVPA